MRKLINPRALILAALLVIATGFAVMPRASAQEPITVTYDFVFRDSDGNPAPLIEGMAGGTFTARIYRGEAEYSRGDVDCSGSDGFLDVVQHFEHIIPPFPPLPGCVRAPATATIRDVAFPDYGIVIRDFDPNDPDGFTFAQFSFADGNRLVEPGMGELTLFTLVIDMPLPSIAPLVIECLQCDDDNGDPIDWPLQVVMVR